MIGYALGIGREDYVFKLYAMLWEAVNEVEIEITEELREVMSNY